MLLLSKNLEDAMQTKFNIWLQEKQCEEITLDRFFSDYDTLNLAISKLNNHERVQYDFMNTDLRTAYSSFIEADGRYKVQLIDGLENAEWYLQKVLVFDNHKNEFVVYLYNAMSGFSEGSYFPDNQGGFDSAIERFKEKQ